MNKRIKKIKIKYNSNVILTIYNVMAPSLASNQINTCTVIKYLPMNGR